MMSRTGDELSLAEAVETFRAMRPVHQLASLHPAMVEIDANRDASLRPVYWRYREQESALVHSFHLGENPGLSVRDVQSPYGYGGPISNDDDPRFLHLANEAYVNWARERSVVAEFLRFHPLIPHARWYPGSVADNRATVHIDLTADLFAQYQTRRRTDVRRFLDSGARIVHVTRAVAKATFPALYAENMRQIGASNHYLFPEVYFDALLEYAEGDAWIGFVEDEPVAGAVVLASPGAGVVEYHLGAKIGGADRSRAMVGLLHTVAEHYQSLSYRSFYLGGGRSAAPDDTLLFFKRAFSRSGGVYRTGSRVLDGDRYSQLQDEFPVRAATGRVLFYKDF